MAFILLLNQVDTALPVLLAASRPARRGFSLSRPGLRSGEPGRLATWEKESGLTWAGIGRSGLAGALVGGEAGVIPREADLLSRALACSTPREGAGRCIGSERWREIAPFRLVLAGAGEAWLVEGREEITSRELSRSSTLLGAEDGEVRPCPPGIPSPAAAGLATGERVARLEAALAGGAPGTGEAPGASPAAVILGLAPGRPLAGRFLFRPAADAGGRMLDYSNLLRRLRR